MKKEKRILTAVSLLFAASVVFVFLNALDVKLGLCGGGCPDCLCDCNVDNPGSVTPCGEVCPCDPACGENEICGYDADDNPACLDCADFESECGTHYGLCVEDPLECNCDGNETSCECSEGSCVGCTAPDTCIAGNCIPPGCSGIGCFAELLPNTQDSGEDCGEGMFCLECIDDYSWDGDACVADCVPEVCNDGVDNDCDGQIDCADSNCVGQIGPSGKYCCPSGVGNCPQDDCKMESCAGNECTIVNRPAGATDECGACAACNIAGGNCTGITAETGKNCTADCRDCVAGSCNLVTEANDGGCTGADTYCCSGSCVNPPGNPSELGGACGSGDCTGGTWGCNGSNYECSSIGTECDRCSGDKRYDSVCDKDGACDENEHDCDACNTCQMSGTTASCAEAYERIQDTVDPNLCNGAGQVCHDGRCCDIYTCGDGANECGLGQNDNCGGTINCYCDKTDISCECAGGSCQSCSGTDASCWCDAGVPGAGGECKSCHGLQVCKVDGAGIEKNECIGRGIVPPHEPSDVPGDFEQSIMNITNWLAGFIVMLAILAMIYGGFIYLSSSGDQEKTAGGKKVVTYALLGLIVAGIAYAAVKVIVDIL